MAPHAHSSTCCPVLELRQYTLHPGQREVLIALFERAFIEPQEELGIHLVGQFRDLDRPDRFVWLRGFEDMHARETALRAFYGGPVWKTHRDEANATMIDSDNVLLLRPLDALGGFALAGSTRPAQPSTTSTVFRTDLLFIRSERVEEFGAFLTQTLLPAWNAEGARPIARFQSEHAHNTFPALPVRTGENAFVWFTRFADVEAERAHQLKLERSRAWTREVLPRLDAFLDRAPERLRLASTARSILR